MSTSPTTATETLQQLIAPWPFVQLISSREHYPRAPGTGLPLLKVDTPLCNAVIALQGAQLLEFTPRNGEPLLWLSPRCRFEPGSALRGGVPICLPWFGINRRNPSAPKHGFARNRDWQLTRVDMLATGVCILILELESPAGADFDRHFHAELRLELGNSARLILNISNRDEHPMVCSWALHSYHPVSSLADARVPGLTGREYVDNLQGLTVARQTEELVFISEVDRVFPGVDDPLVIQGQPRIALRHHNCPSVITWNPGAVNAAAMADVGPGGEQAFICVERGAVLDEEWTLAPGETRGGWLEIASA